VAVDLNIRFPAVTRDCLLSSEFLPKWDQPSHPGGLISDIKCKDDEIYCLSAAKAQIKNLQTCNYTFTYVCTVSSWIITQHMFMHSYNTAWRNQTIKPGVVHLLHIF